MEDIVSRYINLPRRNSKDWSNVGIKGYVNLMTGFMKLSPSYDLARRYRTEQWPKEMLEQNLLALYGLNQQLISIEDKQSLINDFNRVLMTYDEFGNLTAISFEDWWEKCGRKIFGFDYQTPIPTILGQLESNQDVQNGFTDNLNKYMSVDRALQGKPPTIFIALPLGIPKRRILKQISLLIDQAKVPVPIKAKSAKRSFTAQRLRSKALSTHLVLLMMRIKRPDLPLWKLGFYCNISPKSLMLGNPFGKPNSGNLDLRNVIGALTSRALKKAMLIAEHAARGDFPLSTKRRLPVFDWDELYESMRKDNLELKPREPTHKQYKNNVV